MAVAARTLGASEVFVHVHEDAVATMDRAIAERRGHGLDPVPVALVVAPDRYLAGQESVVVNAIGGQKPATPSFTRIRTVRDQGVAGRPTLVQNVESLAHVALIARFGAEWFRSTGTAGVAGDVAAHRDRALGRAPDRGGPAGRAHGPVPRPRGGNAQGIQGVLLGGYGGGWLPPPRRWPCP